RPPRALPSCPTRRSSDLGRIVGHREVISAIARSLRRNFAGLGTRRPMGSFLFLGPSGVGKTELAKALAEVLFASEKALVRFDMRSEEHTSELQSRENLVC